MCGLVAVGNTTPRTNLPSRDVPLKKGKRQKHQKKKKKVRNDQNKQDSHESSPRWNNIVNLISHGLRNVAATTQPTARTQTPGAKREGYTVQIREWATVTLGLPAASSSRSILQEHRSRARLVGSIPGAAGQRTLDVSSFRRPKNASLRDETLSSTGSQRQILSRLRLTRGPTASPPSGARGMTVQGLERMQDSSTHDAILDPNTKHALRPRLERLFLSRRHSGGGMRLSARGTIERPITFRESPAATATNHVPETSPVPRLTG